MNFGPIITLDHAFESYKAVDLCFEKFGMFRETYYRVMNQTSAVAKKQ